MSLVRFRRKRRTAPKMAKKVSQATKSYVNKKVKQNIDLFEHDTAYGQIPIFNASAITDLSASLFLSSPDKPPEIQNQSLQIRMRCHFLNNSESGTVRYILFKWKPDSTHHQPSAQDVLKADEITSPYVTQDLRTNFSVIKDGYFTHGARNGAGANEPPNRYLALNYYKRLGKTQFNVTNPTANNGEGSNHIFLLIIGSIPSQSPFNNVPIADVTVRNVYSKV